MDFYNGDNIILFQVTELNLLKIKWKSPLGGKEPEILVAKVECSLPESLFLYMNISQNSTETKQHFK